MGNINELYEEQKRKEEQKKEFQLLNMKHMAHVSEMYDKQLDAISKDNRKKRNAIKSACVINNIPHYDNSIILLMEDGKKNIYSTYSWFDNDVTREIITEFMESINEPLVLDENGNPTNDIEWHFYNHGTALYDVLKEKGYLDKGSIIKDDSDNIEMMEIRTKQRINELQRELDILREKKKNYEEKDTSDL